MRLLQWWMAACLIAFGTIERGLVNAQDTSVGVDNFLDSQTCYDALYTADVNGDRKVSADEYVTVVQMLGPDGFMADAQSFADLPFLIKATFNALACLCESNGGSNDCCVGSNAHISNNGTAPGETPTPEQSAYLFTACLATERSIDQVLATNAPTTMPSDVPTVQTTPAPSLVTPSPTVAPSTIAPSTSAPTNTAPTPAVTVQPTAAPTTTPVTPTLAPSAAPSVPGDTDAPTASPTIPPPTVPTAAPTQADLPLQISYLIQIADGVEAPLLPAETDELAAAMDILAPQVADETFGQRRRLRRRLEVTVLQPTSVIGSIDAVCPDGTPSTDSCEDVTSSITLMLTDEDRAAVETQYDEALTAAINEGRLEDILLEINPDSRISVVSSEGSSNPGATTGSTSGLGGGATAGIAIAAVATVLAVAGLLVARRRTGEKDDIYYAAGSTQALAESDQNARDAREIKSDAMLGATQADYGKKGKQAVQASVIAFDSLDEDDGQPIEDKDSGDSSSNAGSSGWSSSAGVSSLNTGSADSLDFQAGHAVGATLAAIGAASAITMDQEGKRGEGKSVPNLPTVSRADLDTAIEAGDWAAVGATAALLAAASTSDSRSESDSRSGRSSSRGGSAVSSIDAARAAELDHLVDAGDWEGVVLAAAKFEASADEGSKSSKGSKGSSTRSLKSGSAAESRSIGGSTGAASSGYSPSVSDSESPSKQQKRAEIRAEVEALVRRVVPEEIDNVDEMMLQFKGREEELVETLRTMQERAVAQKARVQGQKTAKREARSIVQQGGVELPVPGPAAASAAAAAPVSAPEPAKGISTAAAAGAAAGAAAALGVAAGIAAGAKKREEKEKEEGNVSAMSSEDDDNAAPILLNEEASGSASAGGSSGGKRRTALELAIEAGDWEAVGEAAAMMSDTSVTTTSSTEIQALAEDISYDDEDSDVRRMRKSGVNAERAAELDAMIDAGNWTGVVAAAGRFSKNDTMSQTDTSDSSASDSKQSGEEGKKRRSWFGGSSLLDKKPAAQPREESTDDDTANIDPDKARKEEEDALAQAEIWMAIANQSKQEGSTDAGASDAADWAIARSLSALRSAEARGELSQPAKDGSPPASISEAGEADSKGDRSV